jgi:hypothetical protein
MRPVWVEVSTYVGIIGGSSYDYLAYVSYLRDKHWGRAGSSVLGRTELEGQTAETRGTGRRWLRVPMIDCTLSFATVLLFAAVFLVCGAVVLGPQHKVPDGSNLLSLQAEFVSAIHPWFKHLYFAGAFLAVFGTLYGTIEVAPTILREMAVAVDPERAMAWHRRLRLWSVGWAGWGGMGVLILCFVLQASGGSAKPPGLIALVTPANLFTGVLGCGIVCLGNLWMDRRFVPTGLRMSASLAILSGVAVVVFGALGAKAYWDDPSRWMSLAILAGTVTLGVVGAAFWGNSRRPDVSC